MASTTQIANRGLLKLGQPRVSNIETDNSPNAIVMNDIFGDVRDELLQSYPWNFAIKRKDIASDATPPVWGWGASYSLPPDCLRVLEIDGVEKYSVENGKILCNESGAIYIKYIYRVTDPNLFSFVFSELFSVNLAIEASDRITAAAGLKSNLLSQRREILNRATSSDSIENPPEYFDEDAWLTSRL